MSCFCGLFAKRLLKFCKYFFLNDIFLSFIDIMSTVSLQNMLCGLNILCVKLHMFCIFSKGISPRQICPPYFCIQSKMAATMPKRSIEVADHGWATEKFLNFEGYKVQF